MKTRSIKYKMGEVGYLYNPALNWTKQDQQLADLMAKSILCSENMLQETNAYHERTTEMRKWLRDRLEKFEKVGDALEKAQQIAGGYVGAIELGQFQIAEMLSDAINAANDAIQEQNEAFREHHPTYEQFVNDHNLIQDAHEEQTELVYQELSTAVLEAFKHEDLATDMVSFDRTMEQVRAIISVNTASEEQLLRLAVDVMHELEILYAKVEGQQNVWEEFCNRLVLIEYIGKLRSDSGQASFN